MTIRLLDYNAKEHFVSIPDDTEELIIDIVSGDMILVSPVYYDTGKETRVMNFYDGSVVLYKEDFSKLNEIKDSVELFLIDE